MSYSQARHARRAFERADATARRKGSKRWARKKRLAEQAARTHYAVQVIGNDADHPLSANARTSTLYQKQGDE